MSLVLVLLAGGLVGAGLLLTGYLLAQPRTSGPVALAQLDARLARGRREASLTADRRHQAESARMRRLGSEVAQSLETRGVSLPRTLGAALSLVGQSQEMFLARSLVGALLGFLVPVLALAPVTALGFVAPVVPLWLMLIGAAVGTLVPYADVVRAAESRRRDFRYVVSSFLDLVAMNLAGGRGVPEALQAAASISDGWAMVRIRDTLEAARLQGTTPWAALGQLGEELDVDELRDLAAALALVAEDGAKVRDSLTARAASMRKRELADAEGRAAARSQSMLVAQLLLCVGFLLFLTYPAVARVLG
ncbi:type II secretion system F family protein [Nocardioides perillae]|uniref:Flp pilus assembly protein TadB n=1 Tax=Nocardioides perillae TaxID=1119534 RepID=A0A7Y9RUI2_9ACTN|nr:Flp pilus assembly protein TadB [Nocardioides perillae]